MTSAPDRWLEESVGVRLRSDVSVLDVSGDDQRSWLNGQISNDVRSTKAGDGVYALVLNVRGKILCDLWALDRGDGFSLVLPSSSLDAVQAHLEQYIIMEDVVLSRRDDGAIISVQGPHSADAVTSITQPTYRCDELGAPGQFVLTNRADVNEVMETLTRRAVQLGGGLVTEAQFEIARVRRGVPRFGHDFDSAHYPQEAGLKTRAVSFSKGCYLGQEVVCTLESRGKLSRKLVNFAIDGDAQVGDAIINGAGDESGKLTSVVRDQDHGRGLGYVRRIHLDAQDELRTAAGRALTIDHVVGQD